MHHSAFENKMIILQYILKEGEVPPTRVCLDLNIAYTKLTQFIGELEAHGMLDVYKSKSKKRRFLQITLKGKTVVRLWGRLLYETSTANKEPVKFARNRIVSQA